MKSSDIFYSLTIQDIHMVAEESLERRLSEDEIIQVIPVVENLIDWHSAISDAIRLTAVHN
ncbi:MAG: hypothetical protein ACRD6X_21285 [Pyrinomonadaceae bacterium]